MKQKVVKMQGEIDKSPIIIRDLYSPPLIIDRTSKQKIGTEYLNNAINQLNLTDIYRALYTIIAQYILFYGVFTKMDHILGPLNKFPHITRFKS